MIEFAQYNPFQPFPFQDTFMVDPYRVRQRQEQARRERALRELARREAEKRVHVQQAEDDDVFQIQLLKEYGGFESYGVRAIRRQGTVYLKIESEQDEFCKIYELNETSLDVAHIDWKWYKKENAFVVTIPKLRRHKKTSRRRKEKEIEKERTSKIKTSKIQKKESEAPKQRSRTPSIEEVEDEEFILYRKQMAAPIPKTIIE